VDAAKSGDREAMLAALAPTVTLWSPVSFKPYEGNQLVATIITEGPYKIFRDFEYVHHLEDPGRRLTALIFRASIYGRLVDGLDLLHFDDSDRVDELTVMLRPLSGVSAMADAMGRCFEELGLAAAPG
jgi:hypothetical protein